MSKILSTLMDEVNNIEKKIIIIAMVIAISVGYYINPLDKVDVTDWNRTFCLALLSGISIDTRIGNFYRLFFLYLPLITILVLLILLFVYKKRPLYIDFYSKLSIFLAFSTIASYISRYTADASRINENPMLQCMLAFFVVLTVIALLDKNQAYQFNDIVSLFLFFLCGITTSSMIFHYEKIITYIVFWGVIEISFVSVNLYTNIGDKVGSLAKNYALILLWIPAIIRTELEVIYYYIEKGRVIHQYFTYISRTTSIVIVLLAIYIYIFRKKNWKYESLGYVGAIVSATVLSSFQFEYQYLFSYGSMANIYELGNDAVAMDSYLYGKIPIVDYFSAHALNDVWTQLIYCFIHNDINGILVDPYGGLSLMIAFIILYYIIKQLFNAEIAVLFVILFPGITNGIKFTSICCISIAMLLYICRKPFLKNYVLYWLAVLIGAFMVYDEGIALGLACICAYVVYCLLQKDWRLLRNYTLVGVTIAVMGLFFYMIYASVTGIPIIARVKEWLSVSVGSSSSWATADFGDYTSFAFFISYFVVPIIAVILLVAVLIIYYKSKQYIWVAITTVAFALTEILYITRTIVFHNLAVCSGVTGVLLNYIHWTIALYSLYISSIKGKNENVKLLVFSGAMFAVILLEGTSVTHYWPSADSSLINKSLRESTRWDLQDNIISNDGQPRIVYDDATNEFVTSFTNVFDKLLTEKQTFIDFANITSLYLLVGKTRPCYVGQVPSLLTDLYSQECFLNEISKYDCPLTIIGVSEASYLQQMAGIPHNVRYYKIAEYIYSNYRPLVNFGEFSIWCEKGLWDVYHTRLEKEGFSEKGYTLVDYGYDFTTSAVDEKCNIQYIFMPYHSYDLGLIPYIWANNDNYSAINNNVLVDLLSNNDNKYEFEGSQTVNSSEGNYIAFVATNNTEDNISTEIVFYDSTNEGAKFRYYFTVKPGKEQYLIRASEDYFWDIYNIDTIMIGCNESVEIQNVGILEGD